MTVGLYPETATDALAKWDAGESVFTIEMGGLGPGYEQAIQMLVFEIIRDHGKEPLPLPENAERWGDDTVHRCDKAAGGFSGAQVGAAKQIAYRAIRDGWRATLESVEKDRHIQVSNFWPRVKGA